MSLRERDQVQRMGMVLAILNSGAKRKVGDGFTVPEFDQAIKWPVTMFPILVGKYERYLDADALDIMTLIIDGIDGFDDYGTKEKPLSADDQSDMLLSYFHAGLSVVSAQEAADMLGVSKARVYKLLEGRGGLFGFKNGKTWHIFRNSVENRIADRDGKERPYPDITL